MFCLCLERFYEAKANGLRTNMQEMSAVLLCIGAGAYLCGGGARTPSW